MTNTLGAQLTDRLPDALRPCGFTGMHGDVPACVASAVKVGEEQTAREAQLITRQIDGGDVIPVRQQRFQLLQARRFAKGTAHDANQTCFNIKSFAAFAHTCNYRFNHTLDRQLVGHRHIAWREAQLNVVQAIAGRIFDVLIRHTTAGIQRGQHLNAPVELAQEADQIRLVFGDLNVRD
ncbi:hypothetical protein D3C75_1024600 [compost metagenome]